MIPVQSNYLSEDTGNRGALEDAGCDIHCPAFPGTADKKNYYAASCAIRLEEGCSNSECKRYVGNMKELKIPPRPRPRGQIERECADCEEISIIKGRELCNKCYGKHKYHGTLDNYKTAQEIHELRYSEATHP